MSWQHELWAITVIQRERERAKKLLAGDPPEHWPEWPPSCSDGQLSALVNASYQNLLNSLGPSIKPKP